MNKVILMGFVGGKPEKRGESVLAFRLATKRRGYTKKDGTVVADSADWHNIVVFDPKLIDFATKYVDKGSLLIVEGEVRYTSYVDNKGIEREGTEIIAKSFEFPALGKKKEAGTADAPAVGDGSPTPVSGDDNLPF